ncbi:MAG: hypothetical protein RRX92_03985 [Lachnospiraceae bacterium]
MAMLIGVYGIKKGVETAMFNMNHKKTKQIISSVIIIILVLAMVIPTVVSFIV